MKLKSSSIRWLLALAALLALAGRVAAADLKLEAQLIWGTTDAQSPDPKHKPVDAVVAAKLKSLHLQWTNFFIVTSKQFTATEGDAHTETLSKNCELRVKNLGKEQVELTIFGRGKEIGKIKQSLPKGELLVTGGNAENSTAWFVALRQTD